MRDSGFTHDSEGNKTTMGSLMTYDFGSKNLTNSSVSGVTSVGLRQKGHMIYVPNFGTEGVIISLGGINTDTGALYTMSTVEVYDPAGQVWYSQDTTGDTPEARIEFCLAGAASGNRTYDILVYAGWDGVDVSEGYDEVFVLSLPSFNWFKADYASEYPRHGLSCEHVGGGQVLTIGGVDTTEKETYQTAFNTRDQFDQGLAIFDMTKMAFASSYTANRSEYTLSDTIQSYYNSKSVNDSPGKTIACTDQETVIETPTSPRQASRTCSPLRTLPR